LGYKNPFIVILVIGFSYLLSSWQAIKFLLNGQSIEFKKIYEMAVDALPYGTWAILSVLESKIDLYFLSLLSDKNNFVLFEIAIKYMIFGQFLNTIISQYFLPKLMSSEGLNSYEIYRNMNYSFVWAAFLNIFIGIFIYIFLIYFYTDFKSNSSDIFAILIIAIFFNGLTGAPSAWLIFKSQQSKLPMIMLFVIIFKIPFGFYLVHNFGAHGAAISMVVAQILSFSMIFYVFKRFYN
jgi:O-antigen/teichoic acid export membrane protein